MLSYAEIPFIMHRFCIVTLMNSQTIDYNTAIITCEYVATEISIAHTRHTTECRKRNAFEHGTPRANARIRNMTNLSFAFATDTSIESNWHEYNECITFLYFQMNFMQFNKMHFKFFFLCKIASRLNGVRKIITLACVSHRILYRNSICFVEYINPSDINWKCTHFFFIILLFSDRNQFDIVLKTHFQCNDLCCCLQL